jgi:hypothetical protein
MTHGSFSISGRNPLETNQSRRAGYSAAPSYCSVAMTSV